MLGNVDNLSFLEVIIEKISITFRMRREGGGQCACLLLQWSKFESRWSVQFFCKIVAVEKSENRPQEAGVVGTFRMTRAFLWNILRQENGLFVIFAFYQSVDQLLSIGKSLNLTLVCPAKIMTKISLETDPSLNPPHSTLSLRKVEISIRKRYSSLHLTLHIS